jgi:hypothetical protein
MRAKAFHHLPKPTLQHDHHTHNIPARLFPAATNGIMK